VCHAIRAWALAHPHEYALLYGSPVPGYRAPMDTVGPATRIAAVYGRIVSDASGAGALRPPDPLPAPPSLREDAERLRAAVMPGVPDDAAARALTAWTGLFGMVSFEIFGQFENTILNRDAVFGYAMTSLGRSVGLR
jgi:Tetracyclin repressor-like, C-terminal domain